MEKVRNWSGFPAFRFQSEINLRTLEYVLVVLVLVAVVVRVVVRVKVAVMLWWGTGKLATHNGLATARSQPRLTKFAEIQQRK